MSLLHNDVPEHGSGPAMPRGPDEPIRLPPKPRRPLLEFALPLIAVGSGTMLGLALPSIIDAADPWGYAKAAVLAATGALVSFGTNKLAIERGAPLASTGYRSAGATAVGSIVVVGSGLFAATYAGLTLDDTADLRLREHGAALSAYVANESDAASKSGRISAVVGSIRSDLTQKAECEIAVSCISGHESGGAGIAARVVQEHAGRAQSIDEQTAAGETSRQQILKELNALLAEYQEVLSGQDDDIVARHARAQAVDARVRQKVGDLKETIPVALASAYAKELQVGVTIPARPEAQTRLNGILSRHGGSLEDVLKSLERNKTVAPSFPGRTGVSDTLRYIPHFLPIAAIAGVVELIFPLVLWFYTFWGLSWEKYKIEPPASPGGPGRFAPAGPPAMGPLALDDEILPAQPVRRGRPPKTNSLNGQA